MRIFIFILSLIVAVACVFLNILGFNGTLTQTEFLLVNVVVEILLCLILGHFMYRTYANYKRAKSLGQELTNTQAALQLKTKEAAEAREAMQTEKTVNPSTVTQNESTGAEVSQTLTAENASAAMSSTQQTAGMPDATQPLSAIHEASNDLEATTLFKAPFNQ
ncbi:MAG: hypothetical protein UDG94_06435 [Peptococcaceae bacterium]|nr:hypothetical protein [Peptococcaceae bacterium]